MSPQTYNHDVSAAKCGRYENPVLESKSSKRCGEMLRPEAIPRMVVLVMFACHPRVMRVVSLFLVAVEVLFTMLRYRTWQKYFLSMKANTKCMNLGVLSCYLDQQTTSEHVYPGCRGV